MVSKVSSDKSIPMVETLVINSIPLELQYDTQLSFITSSATQLLPKDSYSLGNSSMINLLAYKGEGKLLPAIKVKLYLNNHTVKMIGVDTNLNSVTSHSGIVSIFLGGDNYEKFPAKVEHDKWGLTLLKSRLSDQLIIFGPINPDTITWSRSKNNINNV